MPNIIMLIDDKIIISDEVPSSIITLAETKVNLTDVSTTGKIKGKLIIVIIVFRIPVCTAIAEVKLKITEMAKEDSSNTIENKV